MLGALQRVFILMRYSLALFWGRGGGDPSAKMARLWWPSAISPATSHHESDPWPQGMGVSPSKAVCDHVPPYVPAFSCHAVDDINPA